MATAILYQLTINLDQDNNVLFDESYINPKQLAHTLNQLEEFEHAHTLAAIIRHCISNGMRLDEELKELIRKL